MKQLKVTALAAGLIVLSTAAFAQAPAPQHRSLMDILRHRHAPTSTSQTTTTRSFGTHSHRYSSGGTGRMMGMSHSGGQIIGNKNTHVFHLPGEGGQLPDPKNRVYFQTTAQAEAAGYHAAGSRGGTHGRQPHMMSHGSSRR